MIICNLSIYARDMSAMGKLDVCFDFFNYYGSAVELPSSQQICMVLQASVEIYVRELNLSSHSCANV